MSAIFLSDVFFFTKKEHLLRHDSIIRDTTQCQLSGQCTQCGLRPRRVWPTASPRATDSGWYCLACCTEFTGLPPRPQCPTHELLMRISGGNAPFYQEGYQQQSIAREISFYTAELARLLDARGADCAVIEAMADSANFFSRKLPHCSNASL